MILQNVIEILQQYMGNDLLEYQCEQDVSESSSYDFVVTKVDGSKIMVHFAQSEPTPKGDTRIIVSESSIQ